MQINLHSYYKSNKLGDKSSFENFLVSTQLGLFFNFVVTFEILLNLKK